MTNTYLRLEDEKWNTINLNGLIFDNSKIKKYLEKLMLYSFHML